MSEDQDSKCYAIITALAVARVAKTGKERELVLAALDHAKRCEKCTRAIWSMGYNNADHMRGYLLKEWRDDAIAGEAKPRTWGAGT